MFTPFYTAISQVERWLENLHDRRNSLDERFSVKMQKLKEQIVIAEWRRELLEVNGVVEKVSLGAVDYGLDSSTCKRVTAELQGEAKKAKVRCNVIV